MLLFVLSSIALVGFASDPVVPVCDCHKNCRGPELVYLCGTAPEDVWQNPCLKEAFASFPFCDETLDISSRVSNLLETVPDEEKLGSAGTSTPLSNYATEMPSAGIRYSQWWSEALHGVAISPGVLFSPANPKDGSVGTPYATSFPQIISTSHSFNRTLFHAIGKAISTEIRAFSNAGKAGLTYWTPNLNIFRDPRWGRGQETTGEDPYLTSQYVESYVPGLQYDDDLDTNHKHLKVSACCKHFVAYSLENYEGMDRHHFNANVTAQDMSDTYMPAFESCASPDAGGASCIMCSYNEVNGVPTCANRGLLTTLARDTWKFDGYITSDCGAVEDIYTKHNYSASPEDTIGEVLRAGMDTECGAYFDEHLEKAVRTKKVSMNDVDRALRNMLNIHMRLGRFDKSTVYDDLTFDINVNTAAHQQLAVEAAEQAVVLLKNDVVVNPSASVAINAALTLPLNPLTAAGNAIHISVIGPNADEGKTMQGNYEGIAPFLITPLAGIVTTAASINTNINVDYALGCEIEGDVTSGFDDAIASAKASDVVVLVMGIDQSQEREGVDRTSISLPGVQADLIEAVLQVSSGKPVVLVVEGGGAVCLKKYKDDSRVSSVLFIGYPGQAGGQGLANVLFGRYSPSGRLTQTFYSADYINEVSFYDYNMRPVWSNTSEIMNPGRGYRFYTGNNVVYPFGYGLSYSSFTYAWHDKCLSEIETTVQDISVKLSILVTNTGVSAETSRLYTDSAEDTILVYVIPPIHDVHAKHPSKVLRKFEKVLLKAKDTASLDIILTTEDFSLANEHGVFHVIPGVWTIQVGNLVKNVVVK